MNVVPALDPLTPEMIKRHADPSNEQGFRPIAFPSVAFWKGTGQRLWGLFPPLPVCCCAAPRGSSYGLEAFTPRMRLAIIWGDGVRVGVPLGTGCVLFR